MWENLHLKVGDCKVELKSEKLSTHYGYTTNYKGRPYNRSLLITTKPYNINVKNGIYCCLTFTYLDKNVELKHSVISHKKFILKKERKEGISRVGPS